MQIIQHAHAKFSTAENLKIHFLQSYNGSKTQSTLTMAVFTIQSVQYDDIEGGLKVYGCMVERQNCMTLLCLWLIAHNVRLVESIWPQ
jgi:hypothetical protein